MGRADQPGGLQPGKALPAPRPSARSDSSVRCSHRCHRANQGSRGSGQQGQCHSRGCGPHVRYAFGTSCAVDKALCQVSLLVLCTGARVKDALIPVPPVLLKWFSGRPAVVWVTCLPLTRQLLPHAHSMMLQMLPFHCFCWFAVTSPASHARCIK